MSSTGFSIARNGMSVSINSFTVSDLGNGYKTYSVVYTEKNLTPTAIDQATLRLFFSNGSPEAQYGWFGRVLPGENFSVTSSYSFTVKSDLVPTYIEYDADHFFSQSPIQDALLWTVSGELLSAYIIDTAVPTISAFSPADGVAGVAVGSDITVIFSEAIQRGVGNIKICSGSATGTVVASYDAATSSNLSINGSTLTIDPTVNLSNGANYYVTFDSGSIKDLAGNSYMGTNTYDFSTVSDLTSVKHSLSVVVDKGVLSSNAVLLKGLTENISTTNGLVTNHTVEYSGVTFDYNQIDSLITTVTRDGEFTSEFNKEINDYVQEELNISYKAAVTLVGVQNIDNIIVLVAGADGNYVV